MASYRVEIRKSVLRELRRLDTRMLPAIIAALDALAVEPRPLGVKKLVGSKSTYRIRVGDYRIIYEINDGTLMVTVVRAAHRKDAY